MLFCSFLPWLIDNLGCYTLFGNHIEILITVSKHSEIFITSLMAGFFYIFWPKNLTLWVPNLLVLIHLIIMLLCLTLGFSLDVNILYMYGGLISFRVLNILTANVHNLLISMVILLLLQKQPPEVFYHKRCSSKFGKIHRKTPAPEPLF